MKRHRFTDTSLSHISLASPGRTITADKGDYLQKHPGHRVVFNANLCTPEGDKIWFGDLDLALDEEALRSLSEQYKKPLFVLHELDGRFLNGARPLMNRAVAMVTADTLEILEGQ